MAGSSLPLSFRTPRIAVPMGARIESAVGIGYDGLDIYGIHALECCQSLVERRHGAEKGARWVQFLRRPAMWKAVDDGVVAKDVLEAAFDIVPKEGKKRMREDTDAALFLFEYVDGFRGTQFMLPTDRRTAVALRLQGERAPIATGFEERPSRATPISRSCSRPSNEWFTRPPQLPCRARAADQRHSGPGSDVSGSRRRKTQNPGIGDRLHAGRFPPRPRP